MTRKLQHKYLESWQFQLIIILIHAAYQFAAILHFAKTSCAASFSCTFLSMDILYTRIRRIANKKSKISFAFLSLLLHLNHVNQKLLDFSQAWLAWVTRRALIVVDKVCQLINTLHQSSFSNAIF